MPDETGRGCVFELCFTISCYLSTDRYTVTNKCVIGLTSVFMFIRQPDREIMSVFVCVRDTEIKT